MIASLRGTVIARTGTRVVIDVGGVGYAVAVTERHVRDLTVGDIVRVHTALVVREDDMSLYGFADEIELGLFELLRTVSGVGPRSALGVLGVMTPEGIARAIANDDDGPFRAVSGIGPKTAKLIVVTLAGKLAAPTAAATNGTEPSAPAVTASLAAALTGLGWPERTALDAATHVVGADPDAAATGLPVLLRRALAELGPARGRTDDAGGRS